MILGVMANLLETILGQLGLVSLWADLEDLFQSGCRFLGLAVAQPTFGQLHVYFGE